MRTMIATGILALAAVLATPGRAEEKGPRDWSWIALGRTTQEEVEKRAGKPSIAMVRWLEKGKLPLDPRSDAEPPFAGRIHAPAAGSRLKVEVLQYSAPPGGTHDDLLVFHQGRLLLALVRPAEAEETVGDIETKYGAPRLVRVEQRIGCVLRGMVAMTYDAAHTAFLADDTKLGCSECKVKLTWCGPKDFAPELEGVEWRLPEAVKKGKK